MKQHKGTIFGVFAAAIAIATAIAGIIYGASRYHHCQSAKKWADYDECGIA